jgi:acetyl esterase/lipase
MNRTIIAFTVALLLTPLAAIHTADAEKCALSAGELEVRKHFNSTRVTITMIRLWPNGAPDEPHPFGEEEVSAAKRGGGSHIGVVSHPSVTVVSPKNAPAATPAVLVCPGGGYGSLGITHGGVDVIQWLNEMGVTGVYMKYRVPKRHGDYPMHHQPLQDIQRAVSLIRARAAELKIDPKRMGVIGFSAGGNLAAMLATHHRPEDRLYKPIDASDQVSCRPDFVMLVAPAYLTTPIVSQTLDPQLQLDAIARNLTPPFFITSASTDKFTIGASLFALVLREKKIPVEVHLYEQGGHAEGINERSNNQWPLMAADWMRRKGFIDAPTTGQGAQPTK